MASRASFWTPERTQLLKEMHADGNSYQEIGKAIGANEGAVCGKVARLGLSKHRPRPNRRAKVDKTTFTFKKLCQSDPDFLRIMREDQQDHDRLADTLVDFDSMSENETCKFIPGDPALKKCFCPEKRVLGLPYCERHAQRCYKPEKPERSAAKPFVAPDLLEAVLEKA